MDDEALDVDDDLYDGPELVDPWELPDRGTEPRPWAQHGRCFRTNETDLFFGPPDEQPEARHLREWEAKQRFCTGCRVARECRAYARRNYEHGVWGGEGDVERAAAGYPPYLGTGRLIERFRNNVRDRLLIPEAP